MREIKFRVWKKSESRMVEWPELSEDPEILKFALTGIMFESIMQYTGLKDKNGKEIYEGDIIEFKSGLTPTRTVIEFQIHCYNAGFYPNKGANGNCYWEIIGNIHENPELIE